MITSSIWAFPPSSGYTGWVNAAPGIISTLCSSFMLELACAKHDFTFGTGHNFKCALFKDSASLSGSYGADTQNYSETLIDEVPNGNGYVTGGFNFGQSNNLTPQMVGNVLFWQFGVSPTWVGATFTTRGCLFYNATMGGRAVAILDFGSDKIIAGDTFIVPMPVNSVGSAMFKLAR
jgi:hypothetical protein